jgi:hypothetical protein
MQSATFARLNQNRDVTKCDKNPKREISGKSALMLENGRI